MFKMQILIQENQKTLSIFQLKVNWIIFASLTFMHM